MRTSRSYRLSSCLTLSLATVCLGQAERFFFPWIHYFVLAALLLYAVAFSIDGRRHLPTWAANVLGLFIVAGACIWLYSRLSRPGPEWRGDIPVPAIMLPLLGPFLTILLIVKLYRPRRLKDTWLIQGMGLLQVGLGCILTTNDPIFGALILVYLASAVWFLTLFFLLCERNWAESSATSGAAHAEWNASWQPTPAIPRDGRVDGAIAIPWRFYGLYRAASWALVVSALGVALFLLIPRFGATQWNLLGPTGKSTLGSQIVESSFSSMDLNRVGKVDLDDGVAFSVRAEEIGGTPKLDLSDQQRWRGTVLDRYFDGVWNSSSLQLRQFERQIPPSLGPRSFSRTKSITARLPDLGSKQFYLSFTVDPTTASGLAIADPVEVRPGNGPDGVIVPVAVPTDYKGYIPPFVDVDWFLLSEYPRHLPEVYYRQAMVPSSEPDLSPPLTRRIGVSSLVGSSTRSIQQWTTQLLHRLAREEGYQVPEEELVYETVQARPQLPPNVHEKMARALCKYLASSGEFTYTLELRRHNALLDPIEDFLRNVKQGHCERYAAALALMLRSQGIPARVVKGFRGVENLGEGQYVVRNFHAHSWVEALIERNHPNGKIEQHWLTLDPTPSLSAPDQSWFPRLWFLEKGELAGRLAWKDYVVDYDTDQQSTIWGTISNLPTHVQDLSSQCDSRLVFIPGLVALATVGLWLGRRIRVKRDRKANASMPEVGFYARLLFILAKRCQMAPNPAQTPREFGEKAAQVLRGFSQAANLAYLPSRVAEKFYRVRFGRQPLSSDEEQQIDRELQRLDAALSRA